MKIFNLALPVLTQAQDDTSTLLSLKVHSALESGVDHLLDAVGSRNVTQMSSLLQDLVEETISEGPYDLDGDVKAALDMIKRTLLADIRGALNEAHCYDQSELHTQIKCFEACEIAHDIGDKSCGERCDGMAHKKCRDNLLELYTDHITKCRALDEFVWQFTKYNCPEFQKKCCLLSHTTWNCGGLCAGQISKMTVDDSLGDWINKQIGIFQSAYESWMKLHKQCRESYHTYVELDADCDCKQADCEARNCQWDQCKYLNCEVRYNECWGRCEAEWERTSEAKECLEKDRKIDWSATEKIECYVNVLLEQPTKEQLLATCGKEDCFNEYREHMYLECNKICVEVDFENGSGKLEEHERRYHEDADYTGKFTDVKNQATGQYEDQDVTEEGKHSVRTRHRAANKEDENRCTAHLDLDYQLPPCCHPCPVRPSRPCEGGGDYSGGWDKNSYMWIFYGQYGFLDDVAIDYMAQKICHSGEHTYIYGYNLCDCIECPRLPPCADPKCTHAKECTYPARYDYSQHDIKVDCAAISDSEGMAYKTGEIAMAVDE